MLEDMMTPTKTCISIEPIVNARRCDDANEECISIEPIVDARRCDDA